MADRAAPAPRDHPNEFGKITPSYRNRIARFVVRQFHTRIFARFCIKVARSRDRPVAGQFPVGPTNRPQSALTTIISFFASYNPVCG